jgi:hypothetical protein
VGNAYYDFLKQDAAFFRNITTERLTEELLINHNYTNGHLELMSELFYAEAELAHKTGNMNDSLAFFQKTQLLLGFVIKNRKPILQKKKKRYSQLRNGYLS